MAAYPINVRLSRSDLARAEQAAALRWQLARASNVKDRLIDTSSTGAESDLAGIKAEIAVAKLLGVAFEATALGIDNGCDMYASAGKHEIAIQVKSCKAPTSRWMLGTPHQRLCWDVAIFVRPTEDNTVMEVYGWVGKKEYGQRVEIVDLGHGDGPGVKIDHLRDIEELWRIMNVKRCA